VKTILDQSHLTPFPLQFAPTYWSYDHTLRMYPLPTMLVMCDTSGWGAFKVMYEGCCVINTGSFLRMEQMEGRGRYTAAWWEWDCGSREGKEISVGTVEREDTQRGKERKEGKKRSVEKPRQSGGNKGSRLVKETIEETQLEGVADETQVEDDERDSDVEGEEFEGDMLMDV
jgi:hypothetical protein